MKRATKRTWKVQSMSMFRRAYPRFLSPVYHTARALRMHVPDRPTTQSARVPLPRPQPLPLAGPRPCLCPSLRRCLPACLSPFYSVPSPFPFRVFIITSLAPPLYPRLGSRICPHPHPEPEPHGRGRRRGAVALPLSSALVCSTRQRAADFNALYSCYGPDAILRHPL